MRAFPLVIVVATFLASCGTQDVAENTVAEPTSNTPPAPVETLTPQPDPIVKASDTRSLIMDDDPRACAAKDALKSVMESVSVEYKRAQENGMPPVPVNTISATSIDKDIHQINCEALIYPNIPGNSTSGIPLRYSLRPSLDEGGNYLWSFKMEEGLYALANYTLYWTQNESRQGAAETGEFPEQ